MINGNLKIKILLAALCCFALVLVVPVPSSAQLGGVVQGTKHGIEKGVDKTKEGAEAVGHGTKELFTGDKDQDNEKQYQNENNRMKPAQTQPSTTSRQTETQQSNTTTTETGQTQPKRMPKTAGELPLLALAGCLSLAVAGAYRLADRARRAQD